MSREWMLVLCLIAGGCTYIDESPPAAAPASRVAARYMPPADEYVKSKLLDFDSPLDTSFVASRGVKLVDDPGRGGNRVMLMPDARIKLGSLLRGREFPGMWDLLGTRVRAERPTPLRVEIAGSAGKVFASMQGACGPKWTNVWLELQKLPTSMPADQELFLNIRSLDGTALLIDDVILAQSRTIVAQSVVPESNLPWRVGRSGLTWHVFAGEEEIFALPAAPFIEDGFRVVESNPVRTVFASATSTIAVDRNGRLIENHAVRADPHFVRFAKTTAENNHPASVDVASDDGRVERNLPGDRDNDGYDESRGCYTIRTQASRLRVKLTPGTSPVRWPVLEIIGLPAGAASVWLEGQLVPYITRLADGKTIIELPIVLERSVEIQIRVK